MIIRRRYISRAEKFIDTGLVKVFTGIRRSGKTVILQQMAEVLKNRGVGEEQILMINLESLRYRKMAEEGKLYSFILKRADAIKKRLYVMLDEVQVVPEWQVIVNSLRVDMDCDLYITGSNAALFSSKLATYLSGRYIRIEVYPFTFSESKEMMKSMGKEVSDERLFMDYLKYGGFPQRFYLPDEESVETYLRDIYEAVVMRDVVSRHSTKNPVLFGRVLSYVLDNVGNPFSARKVSGALTSAGMKVSVPSVLNYLDWLKEAFIILPARRYDLIGKEILGTMEKYYAADLGLRNIAKNSEKVDSSKLYENIVFLEMKSRGYEVEVGKWENREIDFICRKGKEKLYIQVAYLITETDEKREFGNLEEIKDNYPKYVISGDLMDLSRNGIIHKNIIRFLLDEK